MNNHRIVITQIGVLCAAGKNISELTQNLPRKIATTPLRQFAFHELSAAVPCYRIDGFDPAEVLGKKGLRNKDWPTKLLLGCLERPFGEICLRSSDETRPGLCVGTAFGSVQSIGDFLSDSIVSGVNNVNPQDFANTVINAPTGNANIRHAIHTLSATVSTGFNAGLDAIIYAADYLTCGYCDAVIAGGLEELSYYSLAGLAQSKALSSGNEARPFAADADGMVMGEGCGLLLLETEESARRRGATVLAELAGWANTFDPVNTPGGYNPKAEGANAAIRGSLEMAHLTPREIGFVASGANGNRAGDTVEARLLSTVFNDTPVAAYKIKTGECYGASGAISLICAYADMSCGRISGTESDYPLCNEINLVKQTIKKPCTTALVTSFSCDGNCSSIVLKMAQ